MIFAIALLAGVVTYSTYKLALSPNITKKNYKWAAFAFIAGAALLAFYFHPTRTGVIEDEYATAYWDISRYYIEIVSISRYTFKQVLALSTTVNEPLRFPLWYLFSLLPSLEYFQAFAVIAACGMLYYCTIKQVAISETEGFIKDVKGYRFHFPTIILSCLSLFAMVDYFEMMNTGRNLIACMLAITGIVQVYRWSRKLLGYILIFIAGMLHITMLGVLLLVLFNDFFIRFEKAKIILLAWRLFLPAATWILKRIPYDKFSELADKIAGQVSVEAMTANRIIYELMFAIFSICAYYFAYRKKNMIGSSMHSRQYIKILNLIQLFLILMLGGLETNISYRLGYIAAIMSPFFLFENDGVKCKITGTNFPTVLYALSCVGLIVYDTLKSLVIIAASGAYFG